MQERLHIVCPHCLAVNRVPGEKIDAHPRCGRCKEPLFTGRPLELDAAAFDRHLAGGIPLVVDFWAPWCGPCKTMAPVFAEAARRIEPRARLAKVNTEAEPGLAARFGIQAIPTMIVFRGGVEAVRQSGALPLPALLSWLETHL